MLTGTKYWHPLYRKTGISNVKGWKIKVRRIIINSEEKDPTNKKVD
jgi:hypothetical protein